LLASLCGSIGVCYVLQRNSVFPSRAVPTHQWEELRLRKTILVCVAACFAVQSSPAVSGGNIAEGEKVFQRCFSCHSVAEEDPDKKGPSLGGIVGRPVASVVGYAYSAPMTALGASGAKWDEATLDEFLKYPSEFVKGTKMTAPPVRRETERVDLIAFLGTLI
jgi:cytochrome c